jgi:hypothetical protein
MYWLLVSQVLPASLLLLAYPLLLQSLTFVVFQIESLLLSASLFHAFLRVPTMLVALLLIKFLLCVPSVAATFLMLQMTILFVSPLLCCVPTVDRVIAVVGVPVVQGIPAIVGILALAGVSAFADFTDIVAHVQNCRLNGETIKIYSFTGNNYS